MYDGQGFWLFQKRLSQGKFKYWPSGDKNLTAVEAHELTILLRGGDPDNLIVEPLWRKV